MKKDKRFNKNSGFVLAETLVVAVAVSAIFALIFKHFFPLIGEYERREDYDDIDSKYGTYWIKKIIQSDDYNLDKDKDEIDRNGYVLFNCENINDGSQITTSMCNQMIISLEVSCDTISTSKRIENCSNQNSNPPHPHIYITDYSLSRFKGIVKDDNGNTFSSGLKEYVNYLPTYSKESSPNGANYRIIVEYYRHRFDTEYYSQTVNGNRVEDPNSYIVDENDFLSYSTIEVIK